MFLTVWKKILQSIEDRNIILQSGKITLDVEAANIKTMKEEMQAFCNSWDDFLAEASLITEAVDVRTGFPVSHKRKK